MSDNRPASPTEAAMEDTPAGRRPAGAGWFVLNATEAVWQAAPGWGRFCHFEPEDPRFGDFGVNIHVLEPGEVSTMYHGEEVQEDFLVLAGECLAIVEGQERLLRAWDVLHCPPWTHHAFVGAGDGPTAIVMMGARRPDRMERVEYPVEPVAQRHGAGVAAFTTSAEEAYRGTPETFETSYRGGTLPGA